MLRPCWFPLVHLSRRVAHAQHNYKVLSTSAPNLKKVPLKVREAELKPAGQIVACSTAEEYLLGSFENHMWRNGTYRVSTIDKEISDALYFVPISNNEDKTLYSREIFVFGEGGVVFWNIEPAERKRFLAELSYFEVQRFKENVISNESEEMGYVINNESRTRLHDDILYLRESTSEDDGSVALDKYTISNALALSVKLAVWELALSELIEDLDNVTEDMRQGKIQVAPRSVLQKTGELMKLRHSASLDSDFLDKPDFYWDRSQLEQLYDATAAYLSIKKRTQVLNQRLDYSLELMNVLRYDVCSLIMVPGWNTFCTRLAEKHSVRLERIIIALIAIEVLFEVWRHVESTFH